MQVNLKGYSILCQSGIGPLLYPLLLLTGIGSPQGIPFASLSWRCAGISFNYHSFYFSTSQPLVGLKFLIFIVKVFLLVVTTFMHYIHAKKYYFNHFILIKKRLSTNTNKLILQTSVLLKFRQNESKHAIFTQALITLCFIEISI